MEYSETIWTGSIERISQTIDWVMRRVLENDKFDLLSKESE